MQYTEEDLNYLKESGAAWLLNQMCKALVAEKPEDPVKGLAEIAQREMEIPKSENKDFPVVFPPQNSNATHPDFSGKEPDRNVRIKSHVVETDTVHKGEDDEGNKMINKYAMITELGRGAFGKVKLVVHNETQQNYAIKIMNKATLSKTLRKPLSQDDKSSQGLHNLNEIAIMKKVNHPNICKLYEVINDTTCNKLYLIVEYLEGGPCYCLKPNCLPLPVNKLKCILVGVCQGLDYLHHVGVIHRDIKPANILLDIDGVPKLTDFGVSVETSADSTVDDTNGTPAFLSPELLMEQPITGRMTDMWALGVSVYMMAFARLPFEGHDWPAILQSITESEPNWEADAGSEEELDSELVQLLKQILHKDIKQRLGNDDGVREVLSHKFLSSLPEAKLQTHLNINISTEEERQAMLTGENICLKLLNTVGVMIRVKGAFKTFASKRNIKKPPASNAEAEDLTLQEIIQGARASLSFREDKEISLSVKSSTLIPDVGLIEEEEEGCDSDDAQTANQLEINPLLLSGSANKPLLKQKSEILQFPPEFRSQGIPKRSFRSEEEVLKDENPDSDALVLIQSAKESDAEDLTLNCCKFDTFPSQLFECGYLTSLTCHLNGLKRMSQKIDYLQMLTTLNLGQNELTELPAEMGDLSSLQHLDVNRNLLISIPDTFCNLEELLTINLDYNNLAEIPRCLMELPRLEKCFLIDNQRINTLPEKSLISKWNHCKLALDNTPSLMAGWAQIVNDLPNVILMWNKVYPDQIIEHLFLGSLRTAQSLRVFNELNITRIVTAGKQLEIINPLPEGVHQLQLNVEDIPQQKLSDVFSEV